MIQFENIVVSGWEAAIRGMRNPLNSWENLKGSENLNELEKRPGALPRNESTKPLC